MNASAQLTGLEQAAAALANEIMALTLPASDMLIRLEREVDPTCSPLAWLAGQDAPQRCYWADRDGVEAAGIGIADEVADARGLPSDLFARIRRALGSSPTQARYYGGIAFQPDRDPSPEWQFYGGTRFVLPAVELRRQDGRTTLACNLRQAGNPTVRDAIVGMLLAAARTDPPAADGVGQIVARHDWPEPTQWRQMYAAAMTAMDAGVIEKLVLARCSVCAIDGPLDPVALLVRLTEQTPRCFHFCFQPAPHRGFVGATPELLCERSGKLLRTEAIAGTRRRGTTESEDLRLETELLASAKERHEHRIVVESIRQALAPWCGDVDMDEVAVLKLARVQHLCLHASGELAARTDDGQLVGALHPTPAVGGWPTAPARKLIARLEPFDRGWYAGPVGWIGQDALQLAVGIRSGLVDQATLRLYAGAGLMRESDPDQEWQEIDDKLSSFINGVFAPA